MWENEIVLRKTRSGGTNTAQSASTGFMSRIIFCPQRASNNLIGCSDYKPEDLPIKRLHVTRVVWMRVHVYGWNGRAFAVRSLVVWRCSRRTRFGCGGIIKVNCFVGTIF